MKTIFSILYLLLSITAVFAQQPDGTTESTAMFWQGFQQEWSYNHRTARLGSYITTATCPNHRCNTSSVTATGLDREKDKAVFTQYGAFVRAKGVKFYADTVSFEFKGKEKQKLTAEKTLIVPDELIYPNETEYAVMLNGFDLISIDKADMIEEFSIQVADGNYEPQKKGVVFDVSASFRANCKGKKCGCKNRFHYKLVVYYLLISGEEHFKAQTATLSRKNYWNAQVAPQNVLTPLTLPGDSSGSHACGLPVFKRLSFSFDKSYRCAGWSMALTKAVYDPKNKSCTFEPDIFFRQWKDKNRESETFNKHTQGSKKKVGFYQVSAEVALIEFKQGCIRPEVMNGQKECFTDLPANSPENEYGNSFSTTVECE